MSLSRNNFNNAMEGLDDDILMADASSASSSSSSSVTIAPESTMKNEVIRYEKVRPIPKLSYKLAQTNLQSLFFTPTAGVLVYQSSFFDFKTHIALTSICRRAYAFFSPVTQASKAAYLFLRGDTVNAEQIVQQDPSVLHVTVDAKDHHGRRVKGTLLQIARLAGHVDFIKRLRAYQPEDEAVKLLMATQPPGWEEETAARMQMYVDALQTFLDAIINAQNTTYDALKAELADKIVAFKKAFVPKPDVVITKGYIFDLQIFLTAAKLFQDNVNRLGGWWSDKSDLFDIVGFGTLQFYSSVCDLQVFKKGIYNVVDEKQPPDTSLNFVAGIPNSLAGLGDSFVLNIYGAGGTGAGVGAACGGVGWAPGPAAAAFVTKLCASKNSSIAMCYATTRQSCQEPSRDNVAFFNNPAAIAAAGESSQHALINRSSNSAYCQTSAVSTHQSAHFRK